MDDTRSNLEAAARLVPGTMKIATQAVDDAIALELGHELMQPMPNGWRRTLHELMDGSWQVVMVDDDNYSDKGWPEQLDYAVSITAATLVEAHRLCREQAWAKHRKNTEGKQ